MTTTDSKFDRDKFLVNQKRLSIKERYFVYDEEGRELFYVERPFRFFGRRNITIYEDDSKQNPVLFIAQDHYWEAFHRNYTVKTPDGQKIAKLSRNNLKSLFRRSWDIKDAAGVPVAHAREDSVILAVIRRLVDLIPFVGLLGGVIKTDFHFFIRQDAFGNEEKIGSFDRRIGLFDKYVLNLSADPERKLDRRVALAVGILLDTAEKR
jgi:uncharacterized protein YxjI